MLDGRMEALEKKVMRPKSPSDTPELDSENPLIETQLVAPSGEMPRPLSSEKEKNRPISSGMRTWLRSFSNESHL